MLIFPNLSLTLEFPPPHFLLFSLLVLFYFPPPPQFLLLSLLNLDFPPPPQFYYFPPAFYTSSFILYTFPSTYTSPHIDPTSPKLNRRPGHLLRPIYTRDFAPGACSRGTLWEQSFSVCTNDFMGILHPREQNFHPAKCSTIFNRLTIGEQAPWANWANLTTLPRVYWHVQNDPGTYSGSKTPRVYWPLGHSRYI